MPAALLALETSTRNASVAIVREDGRLECERACEVSTHSEQLLALVDEALREAHLSLPELAAIACGAGPGSFTGLRIGLSTAKGLCFASDRPLVLVPSLAALAAEAPADRPTLACLDARKGEVFIGRFLAGEPDGDEEAVDPEAVGAIARAFGDRTGALPQLVGDAVRRHPELAEVGPWLDRTPTAVGVAKLAWRRLQRGESDALDGAAPRYVRAPEITAPKKPLP
jgi:tRNA threonylcarbamoyladenosine biosynthesis protein TsaB